MGGTHNIYVRGGRGSRVAVITLVMCSADRTLSRSEIEHVFVSLFIFGTRVGWVAGATSRAARYRAGSNFSVDPIFRRTTRSAHSFRPRDARKGTGKPALWRESDGHFCPAQRGEEN